MQTWKTISNKNPPEKMKIGQEVKHYSSRVAVLTVVSRMPEPPEA
jgi:hypothetical protein